MPKGSRQMLRVALTSHLLPALSQRGFELAPWTGEDSKDRELRSSFPWGRHRRAHPGGGLELVEVQLDKRDAAFRLNLGIVPAEGLVRAGVQIPRDEVWVHYLDVYYTLYRWPRFRKWFSLWLIARQSGGTEAGQADYDALVARVVELLPEVDLLFSQNTRGSHMRKVDAR